MRYLLRQPWRSTCFAVTAALTVGFVLAYLIALPPHLVHHIFDEDHGQPPCAHLAQSQHAPELQPDPPSLTPPSPAEPCRVPVAITGLPSPEPTAGHPRAPPAVTPSV